MTQAARDQNYVPTLIAVLDSDGQSIVKVKADPATNKLQVADAETGSDFGPANALRDESYVPTLMAVSSVDGVTPVVVYADSDGKLLVDSV